MEVVKNSRGMSRVRGGCDFVHVALTEDRGLVSKGGSGSVKTTGEVKRAKITADRSMLQARMRVGLFQTKSDGLHPCQGSRLPHSIAG